MTSSTLDAATPKLRPLSQYSGRDSWRINLLHCHPDHRFFRLTRASGHAILNGTRHALAPQCLLFVPAGEMCSLSPGQQTMGQVLFLPKSNDTPLPEQAHLLRLSHMQDQSALARQFVAIQAEQDGQSAFVDAAIRAQCVLLAVWVGRALADQSISTKPRRDRQLASRFCATLAREAGYDTSLSTYAADLGVTATHLSRVCKSASGMGAGDLITQHRLHAARVLLSETNHPVAQIATMLSFGSPAYFSRFIQRHTGLPPRALRTQPQGSNA